MAIHSSTHTRKNTHLILEVQWLGLSVFTAGARVRVQSLFWELRSHKPLCKAKKKKKEKKNILLNILLSFLETRTRPGVFTCRQCCQTPGPQRRAGRRNGTLTPKHQREPDGAGRCAGGGGTAAPSRGRRAPAHTLPDHRLLPSLSNPTWSKDMTQNVRKVLPLPQK